MLINSFLIRCGVQSAARPVFVNGAFNLYGVGSSSKGSQQSVLCGNSEDGLWPALMF